MNQCNPPTSLTSADLEAIAKAVNATRTCQQFSQEEVVFMKDLFKFMQETRSNIWKTILTSLVLGALGLTFLGFILKVKLGGGL